MIYLSFFFNLVLVSGKYGEDDEVSFIDVHDLSRSTSWKELTDYYGAIEKHWKICLNCGIPGLGTGIHLEHTGVAGSMQPAIIPMEYLITRLAVIDVSYLSTLTPGLSLSLDVALQWSVLKHDPREPTLILFKFGWKEVHHKRRCVCKIPENIDVLSAITSNNRCFEDKQSECKCTLYGQLECIGTDNKSELGLSYELAEWIAANLSHVVGVATDAPTLESDQTREMTSHTVSNVLGRNGVYIIENVYTRKKLPERGCLSLAMPLMMVEASYVPTRLTAFCPSQRTDYQVSLALRKVGHKAPIVTGRVNQVNLHEILN